MRKNSFITVTDQFCGAGGSSQGVREYANANGGGIEVKMALNHWKLAIETHNSNFPDTDHDCTDISACDPRRYPTTDILITSPECTVHSPAGGRRRKIKQLDAFTPYEAKPEEERSRATMWDVPRFAEYHGYNIIIVENVIEAREWVNWTAWLQAMHDLGYRHKCCYFNSMHFHPTPQSRDRMYVVFWKRGNKEPDLELNPDAWCINCAGNVKTYQWWKNSNKKWGKYGKYGQYLYRCSSCNEVAEPYYHASFNIIDWTIPGRPIHDAVRSADTLRRAQYGLDKYGHELFIIGHRYSKDVSVNVKSIKDTFPTQTASNVHGVIMPYFINVDHSKAPVAGSVRNSTGVLRTQTTTQSTGIVMPVIIENNGQSNAKPATAAMPCMTTEIKHGILNPEAVGGFLTYYYGNSKGANSLTDAVNTMTTIDRVGLVNFKKPTLEDCTYRTIKPHEVQKAMAFADDYIILGNGRQKVKQLGNAVTPPVMKFLIQRTIETLL